MTNESAYFDENHTVGWDGRIYMRSVPGKLDEMQLTEPLPCGSTNLPINFKWDGSTVGPARKLPFFGFPKWKHPIASARHDMRCVIAGRYKKTDKEKYKRLRKKADEMFKKDVANGGTWWEQQKGYFGVRLGAFF